MPGESHQSLTHNSLRCLLLPRSFIAHNPDQSSEQDTDSSSVFSLFSAVGLSLTMSHSWAPRELPRARETAAGPCRQLAMFQSRYSWECGII